MLRWPTIPDPTTNPEGQVVILQVMKNLLEMLTGQRGGAPVSYVRVFRSEVAPGNNNSTISARDLKDNDLWIDKLNSDKLNYWDVNTQVWIPTT